MQDFMEVFIPRDGHLGSIDKGSGIAGEYNPTRDDYQLHFEGNRFGAQNIVTWADRVYHAADRMRSRYPTIAQTRAFPSQVIHVGWYRFGEKRIDLLPLYREQVAAWLGTDVLDDNELRATH